MGLAGRIRKPPSTNQAFAGRLGQRATKPPLRGPRRAHQRSKPPKTTLFGGVKEPGLRAASAAPIDAQATKNHAFWWRKRTRALRGQCRANKSIIARA